MTGLLIARSLAAGIAGAMWAYMVFTPRDPFDDNDVNDAFSEKIDRQLEERNR